LLALVVVTLFVSTFSRHEEVLRRRYALSNQAFVTETFALKGHPSAVEVATTSQPDVRAFFSFALINSDTGTAYDFGRELEHGRDVALVSSVPAGTYYLRVEPEPEQSYPGADYEIRIRPDGPSSAFAWIAALLILIPPSLKTLAAGGFESRRWKESDYAS
jgi:hypothetical protein